MQRKNRSTVGALLCVAGCFALGLAPMVRYHIANELIVLPLDQYALTTLTGEDARYLDVGTMEMVEGANVVAISTLRGDPGKAEEGIAVWDSFTVVEDADSGVPLSMREQRMALDRRTAELVDCCGAATDGDTSTEPYGLGVIWPLGNVDQRDYEMFDAATGRTWPAEYTGVEKVSGIDVYRFEQRIGPVAIDTLEGLPGSMLGLPSDEQHDVDRVNEATVTTWVDPRTGLPVDMEQTLVTTLRTSDGADRLTVTDIALVMDEESRESSAERSEDIAGQIRLVRVVIPLISAVFGVMCLLSAAAVLLSRSRTPISLSGHAPLPPSVASASEVEGR